MERRVSSAAANDGSKARSGNGFIAIEPTGKRYRLSERIDTLYFDAVLAVMQFYKFASMTEIWGMPMYQFNTMHVRMANELKKKG